MFLGVLRGLGGEAVIFLRALRALGGKAFRHSSPVSDSRFSTADGELPDLLDFLGRLLERRARARAGFGN
jgi:hypothetical protein